MLAAGTLVVAAGALLLAGCGDDGDDGATALFCDDVAANQEALFNTPIVSETDIAGFVALYREVGENAPLAIEADWDAMTEVFETAREHQPGDTTVTEQDVLTEVYSSEQSALAVRDWLAENCQITITAATVPAPSLNTSGTPTESTTPETAAG